MGYWEELTKQITLVEYIVSILTKVKNQPFFWCLKSLKLIVIKEIQVVVGKKSWDLEKEPTI